MDTKIETLVEREIQDGDKIIIDDKEYIYSKSANLLQHQTDRGHEVACPHCHSTKFEIVLQDFTVYGKCNCKEEIVLY